MTTRPTPRRDEIIVSASVLRRVLAILLLILVVAVLVVQRERIASLAGPSEGRYVDAGTYQAVFLTTAQVYFGKLQIDGDSYVLTDIYYLNSPQDSSTSLGQLIKRGSELHGPADPMVIPARSVLFFENMRQDSSVMSAIRQIKSGNTQTVPPAATSAPTATPARTATPAPSASR